MHYLPLQTTSFVFTIKNNSVLSITQARALGVTPNVTTPSCFSSPSLSLPHLPISLSSDLKSILGFNSFCTQLLFSTQPSLHPIHSLQHTRLILVKERPEMLKFIWTKHTLQDPFQSGSSLHSPFPAPPTAPQEHLQQGQGNLLVWGLTPPLLVLPAWPTQGLSSGCLTLGLPFCQKKGFTP